MLDESIDHLRLRGVSFDMEYRERITIEAGKRGGKPCIRGLRITVYDILEYLAAGMTRDQILADFPGLPTSGIWVSSQLRIRWFGNAPVPTDIPWCPRTPTSGR
jgi:uncharacterized protein (DUF433 family)